jgi:hypothetical protein
MSVFGVHPGIVTGASFFRDMLGTATSYRLPPGEASRRVAGFAAESGRQHLLDFVDQVAQVNRL